MPSSISTMLSRRSFLKMAAATSAAASIPSFATPAEALAPKPQPVASVRKVKGFCPFCQTRCTYHALVQNTQQGESIHSLVGDAANRWTGGSMCPKGLSIAELLQSPHRLTEPMLRTAQGWQKISYEEGMDIVVKKMLELRTQYGKGISARLGMTEPLWDCRESELAALMTMRVAGCANIMPPGEVCISTSAQVQGMLLGSGASSTTVDEVVRCKTLVLWGANINELYPPYTRWLEKAQAAGVNMVYVDCRKTRTSQWCSRQLMPIPGTDGALAMGALRHMLYTGAYDAAKIAETTTGLDALQKDVQAWTENAVAEVTGLTEEEIEAFYTLLEQSPSTIVWMGGALSRYTNGMTTVRAITSLQALTGNLIGPGRGILNMQGGKPEGGSEFVDMVCGPSQAEGLNFRRLTAAMKKGEIDILFLNSSYRRYPDAQRVAEAIKNVPMVVHRGFFMTEEMDVATLFFPATFGPESEGSHYAMEKQVVWRDKIVDAPGSCMPCWQFYRDLGYKLAPESYPKFQSPSQLYEMMRERVPSWKGISLERVRTSPDGVVWPIYEEGGAELTGCHFRDDKFLTPDGKFPFALPVLGALKWTLPKGSPYDKKVNKDGKYPLVLVQGKILAQWQQTLTNFSPSLAQFSCGRTVALHPETAQAQGLHEGDMVMLETLSGGIQARIVLDGTIRKDCIFTQSHLTESSPFVQCRSPHINTILPNYWDRVSAQFNGIGCRLVKI